MLCLSIIYLLHIDNSEPNAQNFDHWEPHADARITVPFAIKTRSLSEIRFLF